MRVCLTLRTSPTGYRAWLCRRLPRSGGRAKSSRSGSYGAQGGSDLVLRDLGLHRVSVHAAPLPASGAPNNNLFLRGQQDSARATNGRTGTYTGSAVGVLVLADARP